MDNDKIPERTSAEQNIKPKFEGGTSEGGDAPGSKDHALGINEKSSDSKSSDSKSSDQSSAADTLSDAENSATDGFYKPEKSQSAEDSESSPRGFYSGKGIGKKSQGPLKGKGLFKGKLAKFTAVASIGAIATTSIFAIGFIGMPMFLIGTIDMNLQDALGFTDTSAILEEQSEYVVEEMASSGEFPSEFSSDLADNGILVGQVTASGDFVRTDTYIADIDQLTDIAVVGHYQVNPTESGQLAFLFNDQVINASDFVATVESNPVMYAAFAEATDITARYYYSNDVDKVYEDAGISRNVFSKWEKTTDHEANMESFNKLKDAALNKSTKLSVAECGSSTNTETGQSETSCNNSSDFSNMSNSDATTIINNVSEATSYNDTSTSELLNMAVSASEPYLAASAFMIVEEPIQRARIDGDGPVNELMDTLSQTTTFTYTDVNTGETVTSEKSVLETANFAAAISRGTYSKSEANNFSRDRILIATDNDNNTSIITSTSVATDGKDKSNIVTSKDNYGNGNSINNASNSVDIALVKSNSDLFISIVGGNRIVEGGSFLSNTINSRVIGAMPSDSNTIAKYNQEVETVLARRASADRATLSPFDISSPHTLFGSIAHSFANSLLRGSSSSSPATSGISTIGNLIKQSTDSLFTSAIAEGEDDDDKFTTIMGDCSTVSAAASVEGDLYCTSHNTVSTGYMKYTKDDWIKALPSDLNDSGTVEEKSDLAKFISLGMDRETTVGVKSANVCETAKNQFGANSGIIGTISTLFEKLFNTYESCNGIDESIATGSAYTLSNENSEESSTKLYSAFALHDTVYSLLSNKKSSVSAYKDAYYAKYPRDNSPAGRLARISGMTKDDATLALNYASYLNYIASYNPTERYAFGTPTFTPPIKFNNPITTPNDSTPILALLSHTPIKNQI